MGAVVVRGSNVIGRGYNQGWKTHPLQARLYPERPGKGLHAEIAALRGLRPYDVGKGTIYVVRLLSDEVWALAKPCVRCEEVLTEYNITRVFYSIDGGGFEQVKYV